MNSAQFDPPACLVRVSTTPSHPSNRSGAAVGDIVGVDTVGVAVGVELEGTADGCTVGVLVGLAIVGEVVGVNVGATVGFETVGETVGMLEDGAIVGV